MDERNDIRHNWRVVVPVTVAHGETFITKFTYTLIFLAFNPLACSTIFS